MDELQVSSISRRDLLKLGGAAIAAGSGLPLLDPKPATAQTPKRGGTFRLGVTGGGAKDMIDGQNIVWGTGNFGTPRGGRRTVPSRKPSPGLRGVPSWTMKMDMAPQRH